MIDLDRFVSPFVCRWASTHNEAAPDFTFPVPGAVLVADLAGFTTMAEQLAGRGRAGIEAIQDILNRSFERVVGVIDGGGGEVITFAGDATLAWWPAPDDMRNAVLRAAATGLQLQAVIPQLEKTTGVPLRLRVAVGAGNLWMAIAGGLNARWEAILGGEPFEQIAALHSIDSGQVGLSLRAWQEVRDDCSGEELADGQFIVHQVNDASGDTLASDPPVDARPEIIASFVPRHLVERLAAGQQEWLAEVRPVSVLFAATPPVGGAVPETAWLDEVVRIMQQSIYEFGGSVVQLLVDDRGAFVLMAAWGVPMSSYADDAERAVRAAYELRGRLESSRRTASVGVASGKVFSGIRGAPSRAEYALIGNVVNLAARLMQSAEGRVWCDEATATAAGAVSFVELSEVELKGIGSVPVFEPCARVSPPLESAGELVGRAKELTILRDAAHGVLAEPTRNVIVVVEGEPGIGKSHLTRVFVEEMQAAGVTLAAGASDPLDNQTAYRPLQGVFRDLLGFDEAVSAAERRRRLLELLGDDPTMQERAPLLTPILDLDLPESDTTRAMSGRGRSDATNELLVHLLDATQDGAARIVVLEDVHWMDSPSWSVVELAFRRCRGLCMVLISRPIDSRSLAPSGVSVIDDDRTVRLSLQRLGESNVRSLMEDQLGVQDVPHALVELVNERTEGHPLFVREVVATLLDSGVVRRDNGRIVFDAESLDHSPMPDTLQGVIVARIDRLSAPQQLALKVASVVGRVFSLETIDEIYPDAGVRDLHAELGAIVARGLIGPGDGRDEFQFSHAVVRETAYELLPLGRRRELHAAVAEWYESRFGDDPSYLGRIARHWTDAHDAHRAPPALERAGDHALRTGAYRESQEFFGRLTGLGEHGFGQDTEVRVAAGRSTRARWFRKLGLADYDLGQLEQARDRLETSARLFGERVPAPGRAVRLVLLKEFGRHLVRRTLRVRLPRRAEDDRLVQVAQVLNMLGRTYHVMQKPELTLYCIIRRFNLVEHREASPELMSGLSGMVYLVALLGRKLSAEEYVAKIKSIGKQIDRPLEYADAMYPVTVMRLGQGDWEACKEEATEALEIFTRLGEREGLLSEIAVLANRAELVGEYDEARRLYTELLSVAGETGDEMKQTWAWGGIAMVALRQGHLPEAVDAASRAGEFAQQTGETVSRLSNLGTLSAAYLRMGDVDSARAAVDEAIPLLEQSPKYATAHHILNAYDMLSAATLTLWELDDATASAAERRRYARRADLVCGLLRRYARMFPIGRPATNMWTALQHWLHGRRGKAFASWSRAVVEGRKVGIPYDLGRAHLEFARHADSQSAEGTEHAAAAASIFERIGARVELDRVAALSY